MNAHLTDLRRVASHLPHVARILVIGGFLSSSERLNDVWVYSVVSRQWEDKTSLSGQRATVFLPRGGHSACCIGSRLWVYGGYGGAMYSRKDLDDVCVLNLETWNWVKVRMGYKLDSQTSQRSFLFLL